MTRLSRRQRAKQLRTQPLPAPVLPSPFVPGDDTPRAHYAGDCRNHDPEQLYGPDRFGAAYLAAAAEYDADRNRTTLYFNPERRTA
ncbi:hypothetical protein KXR83_05600 [Williamsia muralis]|uniref:hypothetical protein n=1 Tax=Williamsia marianensis TaxID=85044 RepID=UPI003F13EDD1